MLHQVQATPLIGLAGFKYHAQLATILSLLSPHDATEDAKREREPLFLHQETSGRWWQAGGEYVQCPDLTRWLRDGLEWMAWRGAEDRMRWNNYNIAQITQH